MAVAQPERKAKNSLHELGYKIFLDRYAQKDMTRSTLAVNDVVIVVVDPKSGQREVGRIKALALPHVTVELNSGEIIETDAERLDKPLETDPSQMLDRVAAGIAAVEATQDARAEWTKRFRWALDDWKFVPAGRILAAAGTEQDLTLYNCVSGETLIHTSEGLQPAASLVGKTVKVLSQGGVFREATWYSYGQQRLWEIIIEHGDTFYATEGHEWVVTKPKGGSERVTTADLMGHRIPLQHQDFTVSLDDPEFREGVQHGYVYGDGTVYRLKWKGKDYAEYASVPAFTPHNQDFVRSVFERTRYQPSREAVCANHLPAEWKDLPSLDRSITYLRGFIAGLIAADGHVDNRGSVMLHQSDLEALVQIRRIAAECGLPVSSIKMTREFNPFNGEYAPVFKMQFVKAPFRNSGMILLSNHRENMQNSPDVRKLASTRVVSVRPMQRYEEVFCCVEPETHTMVIEGGYLTGQCYVLPSPSDSRGGIIGTLGRMTEIMSRGGGVGINVSSLRPRRAYVKGVNGRSSGSVSWGALYSFVTGLIEQGGSRRGALMLILNDWHPDVLEFIASKRVAGRITNANISVGVSDAFMEAVQADADWDLVFPDTSAPGYDEDWDGDLEKWLAAGRPVITHQTIKARELWNAIIESAWASAEPGVWFRERANKMSNSWYFSPLICTNPCVTGDTLVATEHGYTRARDLAVGMQIRTPAGLKPIEKVYNNGVQAIYRVAFSDGGHLECTSDHKLKVVRGKKYEWIPVSQLSTGDKVLVSANEAFGSRRRLPEQALTYIGKRKLDVSEYYDRRLGFLVGAVIGDGTFRQLPSGNSYSLQCVMSFGAKEEDWEAHFRGTLEAMGIHTHRTLMQKTFPTPDGTAVLHQAVRLDCYKLATLLFRIGMKPNVKGPDKTIPDAMMSLDRDFLAGLLDGLFSTDGNVSMKRDNPLLRFTTTSHELAQQVRMLLLQFGIHGRIYATERAKDLVYDGRAMVGTGVKYDVVVMNEGIPRFYSEIGLSHPKKAARLKEVAENWHYVGGTWTASVVSVENTGREEEVFDVYEPNTLTWVTNGYVSFDCGEQSLPGYAVCNLGAINLARFYDAEKHDVDWASLGQTVRYAVRFLDNVIDSTPYFFEENEGQQKGERRVGLNTMGIAELMIRLHIRYGSPESLEFIDRLYRFLSAEAYQTSVDIAREKGPFPQFDAEKYLQSGFMQSLPEHIREAVREHGIRNVTLLTQAPNGTIGTMVNTSTGIEPFYSWVYYRKSRLGLHEEQVPLVEEWYAAHPDEEKLPDYFVTAMELTPKEHIEVQAAIQRWVDSSISKTCNVPREYTVEQVRELYEYMYALGCKGGTIYRDGSRDEQVLMLKEDVAKTAPQDAPQPAESAPVASLESADALLSLPRVYPRPEMLSGVTMSRKTPFGTAYITMNSDEHHNPFEVFVTVGKAGSDLQADAEGLGRMISLQLRTTPPHHRMEMMRLIIDQLRGIGGARSAGFGAGRVTSMPDAVAAVLEEFYFSGRSRPENGANGASNGHARSNGAAHHEHVEPVNGEVTVRIPGADLCPSCGTVSLVRAEGCRKCLTCEYTEC